MSDEPERPIPKIHVEVTFPSWFLFGLLIVLGMIGVMGWVLIVEP